jgi:hypothetical protein
MITEDELRDRLKAESVGLMPRGDLVETLAKGHARRHKQARAGLIGGSLAATALVVALLGGLFTSAPELAINPASPGDQEIINRVREADRAARGMIMHFTTRNLDPGRPDSGYETWALRSETLGRVKMKWNGSDTVVKPDGKETINPETREAVWSPERIDDVGSHVTGSGIGDVTDLLNQDSVRVRTDQTGIHLTLQYHTIAMDILIDPKTYLPAKMTTTQFEFTFDWLPATAENRTLLEHTVPADYTKKTADSPKKTIGPDASSILPTK